jgi:hypothetical protein
MVGPSWVVDFSGRHDTPAGDFFVLCKLWILFGFLWIYRTKKPFFGRTLPIKTCPAAGWYVDTKKRFILERMKRLL